MHGLGSRGTTPYPAQAMSRRPSSCEPRRAEGHWLLAGYVGLGGFFALEATARQQGRTASLHASADDRGTTQAIIRAFVLAAALPLVLRDLPTRRLPRWTVPLGLALQAGGLGVRVWSMRTLGAAYSRTLRTEGDQRVVVDGPYRLIRHPGYAGSLLIWAGFGLTSGSLPVVVVVSGLLGRAYARRIIAEEVLLRRDLPGYVLYSRRTKRLVPFVW
jgi:protein-S-isoprenylcysteine O-methyltransferase Ste14